jgi:hypothetical protein
VTASHSAPIRVGGSTDPRHAFTLDGWTTGVAQRPGMWFQVDLGRAASLTGLEFTSPDPPRRSGQPRSATPLPTAPRDFEVQLSMDGSHWTTVARARGAGRRTEVSFAPAPARYLRIRETATATDGAPWSMAGMKLYQRLREAPGRGDRTREDTRKETSPVPTTG